MQVNMAVVGGSAIARCAQTPLQTHGDGAFLALEPRGLFSLAWEFLLSYAYRMPRQFLNMFAIGTAFLDTPNRRLV